METGKKRITVIDGLRGFVVVFMIIYHFIFILDELFGVNVPILHQSYSFLLPLSIGSVFISLSGISSNLSRSNGKRGLICLGLALMLEVFTFVLFPQLTIRFGILHLLGCCMLLFAVGEKLWKRISNPWSALVCFALFLITTPISKGYLGIGKMVVLTLPKELYQVQFLYPLGIYSSNFFSGDYYPLLPWVFLFFAAALIGKWRLERPLPHAFYTKHVPVLEWMGGHSLFLYFLHVPIIYGILSVIFWMKK